VVELDLKAKKSASRWEFRVGPAEADTGWLGIRGIEECGSPRGGCVGVCRRGGVTLAVIYVGVDVCGGHGYICV